MIELKLEALTDLYARDREIVALKRALAAAEQRPSRAAPDRAADGLNQGSAPAYRYLASLNLVDSERRLPVSNGAVLAAPQIKDLSEGRAKKVDYAVVARLNRAEFLVHPREDQLSLAWLGPFDDAPPDVMTMEVEARHPQGPLIDFHASLIPADANPEALIDDLIGPFSAGCWNSTGPGDGALRVSVHPRGPVVDSEGPWAIVFATRVDYRRSIDFGWAAFCNPMVYWLSRYGGLGRLIV